MHTASVSSKGAEKILNFQLNFSVEIPVNYHVIALNPGKLVKLNLSLLRLLSNVFNSCRI